MLKMKDQVWVSEVVDKILKKLDWVSDKSKDKIPYTTVDGVHDDRSDASQEWTLDNGLNWWTNGFWGGMMWQMYHLTKNEKYSAIAKRSEVLLDQTLADFYGLHHDVGFMWLPTAVANYRLTGSQESRKRGMHVANLLAGRFNPAGNFIRAWNDFGEDRDRAGWAIIDCLFNIPLLYWASEEEGDPRFLNIAMRHADTVMANFVRPDGSVEHIVEFDPETGSCVRTHGGQGFANGSSWTRGQAWALYGFAISYKHTGEKRYLDTAKRAAHYFISNIPENNLIPVDFRQPPLPDWEDSSAAAIAASGFIEIAKLVSECEKNMYLNAAVKLLKALDEKRCNWGTGNDCILEKCTAAYHDQSHEFNIIYGDYFFIEAMLKLNGSDLFIW